MKVGFLIDVLSRLNPEADATVWINGTLFAISAIGTENHDADHAPRVVLQLGSGYEYIRPPLVPAGLDG